jgi:hypothetical protein
MAGTTPPITRAGAPMAGSVDTPVEIELAAGLMVFATTGLTLFDPPEQAIAAIINVAALTATIPPRLLVM